MRDPGLFALLWECVPEPVRAALLSTAIALLRVTYDGHERSMMRRATEGFLCGAITLAIWEGVTAMEWPPEMGVFFGGCVGFFGVDQVRKWGRAVANRRIDDNPD